MSVYPRDALQCEACELIFPDDITVRVIADHWHSLHGPDDPRLNTVRIPRLGAEPLRWVRREKA